MKQHMNALVAIAAVTLAGYAYGAPPGPVGGGPMGGMGHSDMSNMNSMGMRTETNSSHAQDSGKSPTQLLEQNTTLATNLEKLLPSGMSAQQACSGFGNLGGCVAAVHVAHNLDIPFADLKAKVTGSGALTLGKAIHALKPAADASREARKAEGEARVDLRTPQP
jgi:hypothetical protein